ncbi:MAG: hypothetical protein M3044_05120 [Thermoproteota archaeon]|nr:hypothetical protein [Thermoproteota archaeon]
MQFKILLIAIVLVSVTESAVVSSVYASHDDTTSSTPSSSTSSTPSSSSTPSTSTTTPSTSTTTPSTTMNGTGNHRLDQPVSCYDAMSLVKGDCDLWADLNQIQPICSDPRYQDWLLNYFNHQEIMNK